MTAVEAPRFNLVDEPWILCQMTDGCTQELSLREVFGQAASIRRVAGELATQDYAVLRILLVIFWRAHLEDEHLSGAGADAHTWWLHQLRRAPEGPAPCLEEYLEEIRDRLWLLHPQTPFLQVADLRTATGGHSPVVRLLVDSESAYFSQRTGPGVTSLALGEAARWLVHAQAFEYSGIKSGAVGDPRVKGGKGYPIGVGWAGNTGGVVLHGPTLAETLVLNTPARLLAGEGVEEDLPAWERNPATAAPRRSQYPDGPCDLLTWQSRRIRLITKENRVHGVLVANGDKVETQNQFADPMTAYRYSSNQSSKAQTVFLPQRHDPVRTLWRGVGPLLYREGSTEAGRAGAAEEAPKPPRTITALAEFSAMEEIPAHLQINVQLVGAEYGTQSSVVTNTIDESLTVELGLLTQQGPDLAQLIVQSAEATMNATAALGSFAGMLLQAAGGDYAYQPDTSASVLHSLDSRFRDWVRVLSLEHSVHQARTEWFAIVREVLGIRAEELIASAGQRALIGRTVKDRNDEERFVSAAIAEQWLQRRLAVLLPLEPPESTPPSTGVPESSAQENKNP